MEISKISAKGQTTIPAKIRNQLGFCNGDTVVYEIKDEGVLMRKVAETNDTYLFAISSTLEEWDSEEDNEAWRDL
jgi:AbrB family looped-hinge helix DNA binding protein